MIKKIFIIAIVAVLLFIFYKKFMANTMDPFFKKKSGNVDFFQQNLKGVQKD